jgi:RNA polymerase sigma factor (sigma-70 family)
MASGSLADFLRHLRRLVARRESDHLSDRQLLHRFTTGHDETAFATLVARHGPSVLAVGRRVLHDMHAAEDVFQATFMVLARKAKSIRKHDSLASWLYGVAYRLSVRARQQAQTRHTHERRVKKPCPTGPRDEAVWQELGAVLDEELIRLPERYRAPLVLCLMEGKTQDEAARQLGWAASTLRGRLERGRELFRDRLERRGVLFSTGLLVTAMSHGTALAAVSAALESLIQKSHSE